MKNLKRKNDKITDGEYPACASETEPEAYNAGNYMDRLGRKVNECDSKISVVLSADDYDMIYIVADVADVANPGFPLLRRIQYMLIATIVNNVNRRYVVT